MKFEQQRMGIGTGAVIAAVIVVILIAGAAYFIFVPASTSTNTSTTSTTTTQNTTTTTTTSPSGSCAMSSTSGTIIIPQGAGGAQQANFCPPNATIVIGVNNTVTWADQDTSAPHNIYFTMIPAGASQPATSPTLMSGDSFSVTLTTPGTYHYECQFHPGWMQGVLTVVGGSTTTTTTSTTSTTSTTTTSTTSTTTTSTTGTTTPVTITMPQGAGSGKNFSPSQITVMVGVNNTVTFTDQDSLAPHNVWFTSIPSGATNPNTAAGQSSGYTMLKGLSVTYTLTTPGTYDFECQFHSSWMQGVITVVAGT